MTIVGEAVEPPHARPHPPRIQLRHGPVLRMKAALFAVGCMALLDCVVVSKDVKAAAFYPKQGAESMAVIGADIFLRPSFRGCVTATGRVMPRRSRSLQFRGGVSPGESAGSQTKSHGSQNRLLTGQGSRRFRVILSRDDETLCRND